MSQSSRLFGFLYARSSFLGGVARLLDFGGVLNSYNRSQTPDDADALALRADWVTVGDDLWDAAEIVARDVTSATQAKGQRLIHAG